MSFPAISSPTIPESTFRAAKASFPKGNPYLQLRDELGPIYSDADFADLYPHRGQPALEPGRLALVTVFQHMENLSDRKAADAVRGRIDWKYALGLELTDSGFDFSVLSEFRTRLLRGGAEQRFLDLLLGRLQEAGFLKAKGKQRTDSTHVLANIRELSRLELIGETVRAALNELSSVDPDWIRAKTSSIWHEFYDHRVEESRLPKGKKARAAKASHMGHQGFLLLDWVSAEKPLLSSLPSVEILRRVWSEQFEPTEAGGLPKLQERRGRSPAGRVESPYDIEARYRTRRSTKWAGYIVHLSETCDPELPRIVTHAHTTTADVHEAKCTGVIHKAVGKKGLWPSVHLADAAYITARHLADAKEKGFRLLGPTRKDPSWQLKTEEAFDRSCFEVDYEKESVTCPTGNTSASWKTYENESRGEYIKARFSNSDCQACEYRILCTKGESRNLLLHPEKQDRALQETRDLMETEEGKLLYQLRAGVEATISQGVRAMGLRRSRYRGLAKTRLQHLVSAAALNLKRLGAWLMGERPSPTRISAFAELATT